MSHIVEIKTQIRDPAAIAAACQRLSLAAPMQGSFKLFNGTVDGLGVHLPGWRYPVVCDTCTGEIRYDEFEGRWGDKRQLASCSRPRLCRRCIDRSWPGNESIHDDDDPPPCSTPTESAIR